ncbi:tRNA (adenosine(37)-N6)-threonylcarbamoyltransferase complex ATPase subunit type 1 TsaE [Kribbia dieselivorans]|uniref:tRNA (adenosine(37)-N6)-threonylcarbamoyltransferase complex ATPase subunit type 1 TsaE n=1 Tax=Kribbia dieselivorans TaxID=331526 RepID=UPI0008394B06|nr:tRNA (adenosine(37)-N6)-threonylcarbamoyltransferase complex ATPase subunit type 1 TsaE [Kribbia dieselivorans]
MSRYTLRLADLDATAWFGAALARVLRAGDLVVLSGDLGAGKTTLTQSIGDALGVRGPITSPTFVIAREHPSLLGGPSLVHVDAYRLGGGAELDDLDLDSDLEQAVTIVEWGEGVADGLSDDRLVVTLTTPPGENEARTVTVTTHGSRWEGETALTSLVKEFM